MGPRTMTGALAVVKFRGFAVGYMRGVTVNENVNRSPVTQLGSILPVEVPATGWSGTISCDFFEINFTKSGIPTAIIRDVQNNTEFENNLVLDYEGVQIDIYKREADAIDPETRKISAKLTPYATVKRAFITTDNTNTNEGAVSGRNQSFMYLDPVIQPN